MAGLSRSPLLRLPIRLNFLGQEKNQELLLPAASDCAWSGAIAKYQRRRLDEERLAGFNQSADPSTHRRKNSVRTTRATAAFAEQQPRLTVGEFYLVPDSEGDQQRGRLIQAVVLGTSAMGTYALDTGQSVIASTPLTEAEVAAYRRHPDTFFGVHHKVSGSAKTPLDLFDFFLDGYRETSVVHSGCWITANRPPIIAGESQVID